MKQKWTFTVILGLAYLAVFHLWLVSSHSWIVVSAVGTTALLCLLFVRAARQGAFLNVWDGVFHASVILDILLEGTLVSTHEHHGFYACAAAFAVVLIGYRWSANRRVRARVGSSRPGTGLVSGREPV